MPTAQHALVLNLHQPAGNLEDLLEHQPWDAKQILYALDRIPRSLWPFHDVGRVHLSLSGTLLETLANPEFQRRAYGIVDCGTLIWHLQNREIIDVLGTAYYHPVLPLIPAADREEQLRRWQGIGQHLFWRQDFQGFWPPEMGFAMELIPLLSLLGYRYVLVDSEYVEAVTPMSWEQLRYRPHIARYGSHQITVVVRDRDLSNAQESGMDYGWFVREVGDRTKWCDFDPLVTTCTDGDNGGWFRNATQQANFWGAFYSELCTQARRADAPVRPTFVHDYLNRHGTFGEVTVKTGAWNTGWHDGRDFLQWTGAERQKDALERVAVASRSIHDARWRAGEHQATNPELHREIENAMWHLLRAETSCNFYWGEAWVDRCDADLAAAFGHLRRAEQLPLHG